MHSPTLTLRAAPIELLVAAEDEPVSRPRANRELHRVRARVYARAPLWHALAPWQRYLARVHAVSLVRPDAVFCLESAAVLLGLPIFGEPRDVHLFDVGAPKTHRVGDVVRHTSLVTPDIMRIGGIRLTSPAPTAAALARLLPPAFGLAVADAAVAPRQRALVSADDIRDAHAETVDPRGSRVAAWVLARVDDAAESPGESVSRAVIEWLGFPAPELQRESWFEGHLDRADFWWPVQRVIGESDGYGKYDVAAPDAAGAALQREKRREDRLRRHVASVARWDWSDAMRAWPLERALVQAGLPRVRRPQRLMLSTLHENRRSLSF